jgi:hypothetical protein
VSHIEEYKEDLQNKVLQLKQILEQQKQISLTKVKYIEEKYQNIKEINVGLEVSARIEILLRHVSNLNFCLEIFVADPSRVRKI